MVPVLSSGVHVTKCGQWPLVQQTPALHRSGAMLVSSEPVHYVRGQTVG